MHLSTKFVVIDVVMTKQPSAKLFQRSGFQIYCFFPKGEILVSLDTGFILQDNVKLIMSIQHGYGFNMTPSI